MQIQELSTEYLKQTLELINLVFDNEDDDRATNEIIACVDKNHSLLTTHILKPKYYIATTKNEVAGGIGLYETTEDAANCYWLAWFCVNPNYRNYGLGKRLLNYAITKAKQDNKQYLRLYTSDDKNEAKAQFLYEAHAFHIYKAVPKDGWILIYRQKNLSK